MSTHRLALLGFVLLWGMAAMAGVRMPSNSLFLGDSTRTTSAQGSIEAHRMHVQQQARAVENLRQYLIRKHVYSPRMVMPRFDTFLVSGTAQPRTRRLARDTQPVLTFAFSGWNTTDQQNLSAFLTRAYPVLVNLYGPPATSATLTIVNAGMQTGVEGGEFSIDQSTGDLSVQVEPLPSDFTTGDFSHYGNNLLHLVLHAFHAPALVGFDAWEEGMARATALIASTQLDVNYDPTYDGGYLLPLYDYLNQPALANATFFPAQGEWLMGPWRVGMAMSAWLKIYAEKPSVFTEFNGQYNAAVALNPSLSGDLAGLKSMLAGIVPTVEGTPTLMWYDHQYALRPTTTTGSRVFVYEYPALEHVSLLIHYFFTNADGTETPLSTSTGGATLNYYGYDQIELFPEEGNTVQISSSGYTPGVGAIDPSFYNIGDPPIQRIRITINVNGLRTTAYFPYWVQGAAYDSNLNVTDVNEFYGAVVGADTGSVNIALPGTSLQPNLIQGAFGANLNSSEMGVTFFSPVIFTVNANGQFVDFRRNIGPGYYAALLVVGNSTEATLPHTFLPGQHMISFPITPHETNIATLLGYPAGVPLELAWWDPSMAGTTKYRTYPDVPAIRPGQAYWLKLATTLPVLVSGTLPDTGDPLNITLAPGWNMVGNSFNGDLNPWAMTVEGNSLSYTMPTAIQDGIVGPLWQLTDSGSYDIALSLAAWEGGWINNTTGQTLVLHQQDAARGRSRAAAPDVMRMLTEGGWGVRLQASTGASRDVMAVAGISTKAKQGVDGLDWQKPPLLGDGVRLAFIHPASRLAGAMYATDIRQSIGAGGETWEFEVSCGKNDTVTLNWPDLRRVPRGYQLVLEDEANGEHHYLRTTPAYTYHASGTAAQPDVRRFHMTVMPTTSAPLTFLNLTAVPTRGSGINMVVRMSAAADLVLDVRSPAGKLIRTINVPAQANDQLIIPWDGRATGGKLVPSGTYLVTITARTAEGYILRRNQLLLLGR